MEELQKIPPHSLEAEQSVLGSMLLEKEAIATATEVLEGADFHKTAYKKIFESIIDIYDKGTPVDLITVSEELRDKKIIEEVGGVTAITELANSVPTAANIGHYAKIVKEKSILRKLISSASKIAAAGYESSKEVEEVLDDAEKIIFEITQKRTTDGFSPIKEVVIETIDMIEDLYKNKGSMTGVPTGFVDFDEMTSGLQPSDLIIIAARPSMGKTAFALNIAQNSAIRNDSSVAVFSLEMSKQQLVQRMLCAEANIDSHKLRSGNLREEDWTKLAKAMGPISESKIHIDDTPGISIMEIRSKARRIKAEKELDLIIIDYLQLVQGRSNSENRQQEISEISRSLKALARELEVPVVALSQLSRAPETRQDHRPVLSDLRESGSQEQDSDIVAFLYRDEYYHQDTEKKNIAEIIVAKQRNGPTGKIDLVWLEKFTKFANLDKKHTNMEAG